MSTHATIFTGTDCQAPGIALPALIAGNSTEEGLPPSVSNEVGPTEGRAVAANRSDGVNPGAIHAQPSAKGKGKARA